MDNETMNITSARFQAAIRSDEEPDTIKAVINGVEKFVPMDPRNRHYKEILRQTEAKTLVVQEAQIDQ